MIHIATVATESQYYFPYLVESCRRHGKELKVIGYGEKWQGFNWRFRLMIDYLKSLPENDIVCFVDGYDVICCRDLNEMSHVFLDIKEKTGCKMITGTEIVKTFSAGYFGYIYFGRCRNEAINAGTYIGIVKDLLEILPDIYNLDDRDDADDQQLMIKYCQKTNNVMIPDKDNKLFLTIVNSLSEIDQYIDIDENKRVTYHSNNPFFIHAPGYGYLDGILNKLGYQPNNIKNELYKNLFVKKTMMYLIEIMKQYLVWILSFILFIFILFIIVYNKTIKQATIIPVRNIRRLILQKS